MFEWKKASDVKVLALYRIGRQPAVKIQFPEVEERLSGTKPGRILLVPPVPISDIPVDADCIVLEKFETAMNILDMDICFERSSVCLTTAERSSFPDGYVARIKKGGILSVSSECYGRKRISCGVLTVSDKGSRGEREDTSGPALVSKCRDDGFDVVRYEIVADEVTLIGNVVRRWIQEGVLLVLTTGGTGLSRRDVTPEALRSISDVEVPGIGETIRTQSLQYTPMAILSRCGGFVSENSFIVALPGSERGAVQSYEIISATIRHAIEIRNGWAEECGSKVHVVGCKR